MLDPRKCHPASVLTLAVDPEVYQCPLSRQTVAVVNIIYKVNISRTWLHPIARGCRAADFSIRSNGIRVSRYTLLSSRFESRV
jgi:hypothetical protein